MADWDVVSHEKLRSKGVMANGMLPGHEGTLDRSKAGDNWATFELSEEGIPKHYVLPTLPGDRPGQPDSDFMGDAVERFRKTRQHYGAFDTDEDGAAFMKGAPRGEWDVVSHEPAAPPPEQPGIMSRIGSAISGAVMAPQEQRDQSLGGAVRGGLTGIPAEIGKQFSGAVASGLSDLSGAFDPAAIAADARESGGHGLGGRAIGLESGKRLVWFAGDVASAVMSPVTGALTSVIGRPVEEMTGIRRDVTGNALSMVAPFAGVKAGVRGAASLAKMAQPAQAAVPVVNAAAQASADYAAAVTALRSRGVELTPGMNKGGAIRRFEEGSKSDPLVGEGVRHAEDRARRSFNRAMYNEVLAPIGAKYAGEAVGNKGVKSVGDTLNQAYEAIKPKLKMVEDDDLISDLADIRTTAAEMPPAQESQFEAIVNGRVVKRLAKGGGTMNGATFKQVESELLEKSRNYKSSADAAQRELGDALEDVTGALRDALERGSDPGVREQLKNINTAWAMLVRLEGAAGRRASSGGLFTPGDLKAAVKTADKSTRKRAFARGDALLQDIATHADTVMTPRLPDSGTAERLNITRPHGLGMYVAGKVAQPVVSSGLRVLARGGPVIPPQLPPMIPRASLLHQLTHQEPDE